MKIILQFKLSKVDVLLLALLCLFVGIGEVFAQGVTLYSYRSGDWHDPDTWTTDPSGALRVNPQVPGPDADVILLNGRVVTVPYDEDHQLTNDIEIASIYIGGILDLTSTSGHNFNQIQGNGRIRMAGDNFPAGTAADFISGINPGTVELYGNSFELTGAKLWNNMVVNLANGQVLTLLDDVILNGNLIVESGTLKINNDISADKLTIIVRGDVIVAGQGLVRVGQGNVKGDYTIQGTSRPPLGQYHSIYHELIVHGNFTNNGSVRFTNQTAPHYTQLTETGAVTVRFTGLTNSIARLNGVTDFYNLVIDKGIDKTYEMEINSSSLTHFGLYGANNSRNRPESPFSETNPEVRKALWIKNGTLKLTGTLEIHTLTEGNWDWIEGSNGDYTIGSNACLWIAGSNVSVFSTAFEDSHVPSGSQGAYDSWHVYKSLSVYGRFRISAGNYGGRNSAGIIYWPQQSGEIVVDGGVVNVSQIRSAHGEVGTSSYIQNGGTVVIRGHKIHGGGEKAENFAMFNISNANSVFTMTGGEMYLHDNGWITDNATPNGLDIRSSGGNFMVTGGRITVQLDGDSPNFEVYSTANLWNLDIRRWNDNGTVTVLLMNPLTVSNNLFIGNHCVLDVNSTHNFALNIGRNFTLGQTSSANTAVYRAWNNTTSFIGNQNSTINIVNNTVSGVFDVFNLMVNKSNASREVIFQSSGRNAADANLSIVANVRGVLQVEKGILDYAAFRISALGNISNKGVIGRNASTGRVVVHGAGQQTITGSILGDPQIGHLELNNANGGILSFNHIFTTFTLTNGILDIGEHSLTIGDGGILNGNGIAFSVTKMIQTGGESSDRGLRKFISLSGAYSNQVVAFFPIGVDGKYSPVRIQANNTPGNTSGFLAIAPVDAYHPSTNSNNPDHVLHYYWVTRAEGFDGLAANTISYRFTAPTSPHNNHRAAYLSDDEWVSSNTIDGSVINFWNVGFLSTDFTSAQNGRLQKPRILYSIASGNWTNRDNWSETGHDGTRTNQAPRNFDKMVIGGRDGNAHTIDITGNGIRAGSLIINEPMPNGTIPTLHIGSTNNHNFNKILGGGKLITNTDYIPSGDWGDFMNNETAIIEFVGADFTLPANHAIYPNLHIRGNANNRVKTLPAFDMLVNNNLRIAPEGTFTGTKLLMSNGADGNLIVLGDIELRNSSVLEFQGNGSARAVTVFGNVNLSPGGTTHANHVQINEVSGGLTHDLTVHGNITMGNSTLTFKREGFNSVINLTFAGEGNSTLGNRQDNALAGALNRLIVNKSALANQVNVDGRFTLNAPSNEGNKALELVMGTFALNNANNDWLINSGGPNFLINPQTAVIINSGILRVTGVNTGIRLDGLLRIQNSGELLLDDVDNNNFIEYSSSGSARLELTGGRLIVGSQVRRSLNNTTGVLRYTQSGGEAVFGKNVAPNGSRGVFEVMNPGSSFNFSAGSFTIARQQSNPSIASLHLEPASGTIANTATITIGNSTTPANQEIGINGKIHLGNLLVNGHNQPVAKLWVNPVTIKRHLQIQPGGVFHTSDMDLTILGNLVNEGSFVSGDNTTFFSGGTQQISGNNTFNELEINPTGSVTVLAGSTIVVERRLSIQRGTFNDGGVAIDVKGGLFNNATHVTSSNGAGIRLSGTSIQEISGNGIFGALTLDNPAGARVPDGSTLSYIVTQKLDLVNGIFDIRGFSLVIGANAIIDGAPFSNTKMVQTNNSFTDSGLRKVIGNVVPASPLEFTFPVGSNFKYTPARLNVTNNNSATGWVNVVSADEPHLSIIDASNALAYNWAVISSGLNNFTATMYFEYVQSDVNVVSPSTEADYIAARLLADGSGNWNKFSTDDVDQDNNTIRFTFTDVDEVSGDYTAGLDDAIPDLVPSYELVGSGNWNNINIWRKVEEGAQPGQDVPTGGPAGSFVIIPPGRTVSMNGNNRSSYNTVINGELVVGNTDGHRLGRVSGNGKLVVSSGIIPAGIYTDFFSCSGGSLEYAGNTGYSISTTAQNIRNLIFSGTGVRRIPNMDLLVCENLEIGNGIQLVNDDFNRRITVNGDFILQPSGQFEAGIGANASVVLRGSSAQTVRGDFTGNNAFNNLVIDNSAGVNFTMGNKEVDRRLELLNGVVTTSASNQLILKNAAVIEPVEGSASSFVNGPMGKELAVDESFVFPTGRGSRYGKIGVNAIGGGYAGFKVWEAQYYNFGYSGAFIDNDSPENCYPAGSSDPTHCLFNVGGVEHWRINVASPANARITLRWDAGSNIPDDYQNSLVVADAKAGQSWINRGRGTLTGSAAAGTVRSASSSIFSETFFALASTDSNDPMPVVLESFKAQWVGNEVVLDWKTVLEINNDHFEVQRSVDGKYYHVIGRVEGNGNSSQPVHYSFIDQQPLYGLVYYRLKQVDYDGNFEIHPAISLNNPNTDFKLVVFPNPTTPHNVNLSLRSIKHEGQVYVAMYDMFGKLYFNGNYGLDQSGATIKIQPNGQMKAGVYFIKVTDGIHVDQVKVVIQ
jgi:hypothetical protein